MKSLSQYADVDKSKWPNGQIKNFKKRFMIKKSVIYGEAGSAAISNPNSQLQWEMWSFGCRMLVSKYPLRCS